MLLNSYTKTNVTLSLICNLNNFLNMLCLSILLFSITVTGKYVSVSKNNLAFDQGQRIIKTKDGNETANYKFIEVTNGIAYQGASAYSRNSTGNYHS